jgi:hypothetical protein
MSLEGPTFQSFVIGGQKWTNMDVRNFASCFFMWMVILTLLCKLFLSNSIVCYVSKP